jgi:RNA polymerase sigma-70 factor (ECF subfamily)
MSEESSFARLLTRLREGDQAAAAEIFREFSARLIALARGRLGARLQAKEDPEDVLQSVFRTFFLRYAGGQYDLDSRESLWSLLACITLRKCGHRVEYYQAARRDLNREVAPPAAGDSALPLEPFARAPTPSEAAVLVETVDELLRGLGPRDRDIVALALGGCAPAEISARLGRPERTVYRVLGRVKKQLLQSPDPGNEPSR